jgi:ribosomal protein S18 acetylase RimI-like enzyme
VKIRALAEGDDVARLHALLAADERAFVGPGEHLDSIEERAIDPDHRVLWAADQDAPLGVLDLALHAPEPDAATIAAIAVERAARRRAVGQSLVQAAIDLARDEGCPRIVAAVRRGNTTAAAFFEALGFETSERGIWVYSGGREIRSVRPK